MANCFDTYKLLSYSRYKNLPTNNLTLSLLFCKNIMDFNPYVRLQIIKLTCHHYKVNSENFHKSLEMLQIKPSTLLMRELTIDNDIMPLLRFTKAELETEKFQYEKCKYTLLKMQQNTPYDEFLLSSVICMKLNISYSEIYRLFISDVLTFYRTKRLIINNGTKSTIINKTMNYSEFIDLFNSFFVYHNDKLTNYKNYMINSLMFENCDCLGSNAKLSKIFAECNSTNTAPFGITISKFWD